MAQAFSAGDLPTVFPPPVSAPAGYGDFPAGGLGEDAGRAAPFAALPPPVPELAELPPVGVPYGLRKAAKGGGKAATGLGKEYERKPSSLGMAGLVGALKKPLGLIAGLALTGWFFSTGGPVSQPPGQWAPDEPIQGPVPPGKIPWVVGNAHIEPLATYRIKARVLHTERYRFDGVSDLAPLDLGVGWGLMSDQAMASKNTFSNATRFLSWHYSDPEFPGEAASKCISNMHLLPATDRVRDRLLEVREGQIVQMAGYLVQVDRPGMNPWISSMTRLDTGNGACEIMWVETVSVVR